MFEEQITESIEAGAPDITYSGNEGPKSPQQEQLMARSADYYYSKQYRDYLIDIALDGGADQGAAEAEADWKIREKIKKLKPAASGPTSDAGNQGIGNMAMTPDMEWIYDSNRDRFANDMFGKDYDDLSPEQIEEIDIIIEMELGRNGNAPERTRAAYGGIMGLDGRKQYGFGSSLKKRFRKLIPNEVAKVAEVAAPFVAPFNPLAAGLMSGIGGFDRTGSIGSSLKSGLMNYGGGQAARYLGGAQLQGGFNPMTGSGTPGGGFFSKPTGSGGIKNLFKGKQNFVPTGNKNVRLDQQASKFGGLGTGDASVAENIFQGSKGVIPKAAKVVSETPTGSILETIKKFGLDNKAVLGILGLSGAAGAYTAATEVDDVVEMDRGGGMDISGIRTEVIEAFKDPTGEKLAAIRIKYPFLGAKDTKDMSGYANGGRIAFKNGGSDIFGIGDPEVVSKVGEEINEGLGSLAGLITDEEGNLYTPLQYLRKFGEDIFFGGQKNPKLPKKFYNKLSDKYIKEMEMVKERGYANGGRARRAEGGLMNLGGMELDYRAEGGFVPIGAKEKADDVPARLSVNEFVFTADAVRNAGGGDIDQGAEIMERVMKNLEQGGQISEETQGMSGAQEMFNVSERLGEVL